jgi:hypothetical protein
MHRKVDPAALLLAVIAVGINPLTSPGEWAPINTVVAGVVGAILLAFTWPRKASLQDEAGQTIKVDTWITVAQAIAYGLIVAIGAAWPIQHYLLRAPDCPEHPAYALPTACVRGDRLAGDASNYALLFGLASVFILFFWMSVRIKGILSGAPSRPSGTSLNSRRAARLQHWSIDSSGRADRKRRYQGRQAVRNQSDSAGW